MKSCVIFSFLIITVLTRAWSQDKTTANAEYTVYNRSVEKLNEGNHNIIRFNEQEGAGIAWVNNMVFSEGIIEFDAKGRNVLQKSFIGIAFHGVDNQTYEAIYFRPFNFQSADSIRRIHAVQYVFEPKLGFEELRNTQKDKFESAIKPADLKATEWFHVKAEIRKGKIKVFVNGIAEHCLDVPTLNPSPSGKKIGFWVGNNSNGDFANLKISN